MALREFTDSQGRSWEAYAVIPRENERRHYDRRSEEVHLDEEAERREADRRITVGRTTARIDSHGWLCFQGASERRRLMPIPDDWASCDDAQLERYLDEARPVRVSSAHLGRPT